jgi:hypothetical protein
MADVGIHTVHIYVILVDWPMIAPFKAVLQLRIDPCIVKDITAPADLEINYMVGQPAKQISYLFQQIPCDYSLTYSAKQTNGTAWPYFIE